ncbi:hypothetical protein ACS0TY_025171 [Phlomoides rotata]
MHSTGEKYLRRVTQVTQKNLIDFFDEYIKVGAPRKKGLSVRGAHILQSTQ